MLFGTAILIGLCVGSALSHGPKNGFFWIGGGFFLAFSIAGFIDTWTYPFASLCFFITSITVALHGAIVRKNWNS